MKTFAHPNLFEKTWLKSNTNAPNFQYSKWYENKSMKIQCVLCLCSLPLRCKDQVSKAQDMDELKSTAQKILIMKPAGTGLRILRSWNTPELLRRHRWSCTDAAANSSCILWRSSSRTRNDAMPQECVHAKSKLRTTYHALTNGLQPGSGIRIS